MTVVVTDSRPTRRRLSRRRREIAAAPRKGRPGRMVPRKVKDSNKTLRVRNFNKQVSKFRFTLFVTKTPNAPNPQFLPLDPGGDNMNGQYD